jgi:hypothetical protein
VTLAFGIPQLLIYAVVPVGVGYLLLRHRLQQLARWTRVWAAIADQLDGELQSTDGVLNWLRRWWSRPVTHGRKYEPSRAHGGVAFELRGLPVLVDGDLEADVGVYRAMHERPWLRVHVACQWPALAGALKSSPGVQARRAAIERTGSRVACSPTASSFAPAATSCST